MADLLPSSPDPDAGEQGEPRVIGVDSEEADDLLAALQSETARDLLAALYDEPATPSALAEEADTSIQNVRYHLEKLTDADLVEVADTVYSEKGREMQVYAPAAKPLVVFAGGDEETTGVEAALSRLLGGVGVLAASSLLVQRLFGPGSVLPDVSLGGTGGADSAAETTDANATWQGSDRDAATEAEDDVTTDASGERTVTEDAGASSETTQTGGDATETVAEATRTESEVATTAAESVRETTEEVARTTTPVPDATTVAEAAGGATGSVSPGLVFFAGGAVVLLGLAVAWYLRAR